MSKRIRPGALWALAISLPFVLLALCWAQPAAATDLTISWQAVTTDSNGVPYPAGTAISYNVYGSKNGSPMAIVATTTGTSVTRPHVDPGLQCYVVTAKLTAESVQSTPPACATVVAPTAPQPTGTPAAPANTKVVIVPTAWTGIRRHRVMYADRHESASTELS